jgi:hypothetical protein
MAVIDSVIFFKAMGYSAPMRLNSPGTCPGFPAQWEYTARRGVTLEIANFE